MPYRAFVSSTFIDLKDHRAHVISSLRRAGIMVDPMEDWTADSDEPKKFSQERLKGCDLCVLLVAFRRGFVSDGDTLSITQLEYEAALKQGIDILPFMLEENAPWPRKFDEFDKDPAINQWREALRKRHGVEPFNLEPRSIDMTGSLGRWLAKKTNNTFRTALPRQLTRNAPRKPPGTSAKTARPIPVSAFHAQVCPCVLRSRRRGWRDPLSDAETRRTIHYHQRGFGRGQVVGG